MSVSPSSRNIEIEYLRAIAIGMTLLSHLTILLPFHHNNFLRLFAVYMPWTGVDLFFCISGYVVSKAYMDMLDAHRQRGWGWLAAQSFWIRRVYRLLPTAWLWIVLPLMASLLYNRSGIFGTWYDNLRSFAAVATFSGNIADQYGKLLGPNSVYWSLALEEQFYFLLPVFLLAVHRRRYRVAILIGLVAVQFFVDRNPFGTAATALAASVRLDALMWGILIHLFSRTPVYRLFEPQFLRVSKGRALCVCLFLVYLLGAIAGQLIAAPFAVGLIALVSALLVLLASYEAAYIPHVPLLAPLLTWLGSRSYGIYVIHVPAYRAASEFWFRHAQADGRVLDASLTWPLLLTSMGLVAALAELNYRFVEQPLRLRGAAKARRRLDIAAAPPG